MKEKENRVQSAIYRQIAEEFRKKIQTGEYGPGMRLPAEATLARERGISVGTIKKAYDCLKQKGLIRKVRGGGSYVLHDTGDETEKSLEETAEQLLHDLYWQMGGYNKVLKEILKVTEAYFYQEQKVSVALVECNEEMLHVLVPKLGQMGGITVEPYVLEDVLSGKSVIKGNCDLVFISQTHYREFIRYAEFLGLPVETFVLRETRETIAMMATIPKESDVYVLYRSSHFLSSIGNTLKLLQEDRKVFFIGEQEIENFEKMRREDSVLLLPPDYQEYSGVAVLRSIARLKKKKCRMIPLNYEIDQGSWINLVNAKRRLPRTKEKNYL
ncbi:MAG TPA: winged helix-turn-helix domain-containing protein [Candidatus Blautia stercoravium]|nr:winged helix-turn-helix domain-containing protein [Candidatus Blautia stercoravium]